MLGILLKALCAYAHYYSQPSLWCFYFVLRLKSTRSTSIILYITSTIINIYYIILNLPNTNNQYESRESNKWIINWYFTQRG